MYKTVRHGENSLQYTILPQTEEVLSNSGIKGKGRDYSPSMHERRSRARSTGSSAVIVTFGILITMIIAAVPICLMNGVISSHTLLDFHEHETSAPLTPVARELVKIRRKELKEDIIIMTDKLEITATATSSTSISATEARTITPVSTTLPALPAAAAAAASAANTTTPPWSMPALRSWKGSTAAPDTPDAPVDDSPFIGTPSGSIQLLDHYVPLTPWDSDDDIMHPTEEFDFSTLPDLENFGHAKSPPIPPGVATERVITQIKKVGDFLVATKTVLVPKYDSYNPAPKTSEAPSLKELKETLLSADDDEEFKESLEVDEVFSLPPLHMVPRPGPHNPLDAGWYSARWPFVDTSSYFQWTSYSPSDNLLLPLLVAALSSVGLVLLLALALRRRRRALSASTHIRTSAQQPEDNTNLLAAAAEE